MTYPLAPSHLADPDGLFERAYSEAAGTDPAADRRSGEGENTAPRSGNERTRSAALSRAAKIEHVERGTFRAICRTGDFVHVRAAGVTGIKTETHKSRPKVRLPVLPFQSVRVPSRADASGLRGVLPVLRRWLNSVWPFKAGGL